MAITFNHAVKYNGKYYPANTPIEEAPKKAAQAAQDGENEQGEEMVGEKAEAPKKAAKSRKKDDA